MIAPMTAEGVANVARALGFTLVGRDGIAFPEGVDAAHAAEQKQYALLRGDLVEFDGTARECAAFLIGWRDLRTRVLGELHAYETKVTPTMNASSRCQVRDQRGERCLLRPGAEHDGKKHATIVYWEDPL